MNSRLVLTGAILCLATAACATSRTFTMEPRDMRVASDAPINFVTVDGIAGVPSGCSNPLVDPRDQTRVRLVRSGSVGAVYQGDYDVTGGSYGVGPGELLRIDCSTGQVLGIVRN